MDHNYLTHLTFFYGICCHGDAGHWRCLVTGSRFGRLNKSSFAFRVLSRIKFLQRASCNLSTHLCAELDLLYRSLTTARCKKDPVTLVMLIFAFTKFITENHVKLLMVAHLANPAAAQHCGNMFCCCFLFLMITFRQIISKSTRPIFAKIAGLVTTDDQSVKGRCRGNEFLSVSRKLSCGDIRQMALAYSKCNRFAACS